MKKFFILFLALSLTAVYAQEISVSSVKKISSNGEFYFPKFSPDDSELLLTRDGYRGLYIYDLQTENLKEVTNENGAGYNPAFVDENTVLFRADEFVNRLKYSTIVSADTKTGDKKVVESRARNISAPHKMNNGAAVYKVNEQPKVYSAKPNVTGKAAVSAPTAYASYNGIAIFDGNTEKEIFPRGEGNYIWVSVSPDNDKILFTKAGDGTYVADFKGNIISEIGYANAPKWSNDGEWIIYMVDEDDGQVLLSSEIYVSSADGSTSFQLTSSDKELEMYPDWSSTGNKVAWHNEKGEVYVAELNIVK